MAKRVTEKEKRRMWELYQQYGSFKKVARIMHRSPDTVSRHVREFEAAVGATERVLNTINPEHERSKVQ